GWGGGRGGGGGVGGGGDAGGGGGGGGGAPVPPQASGSPPATERTMPAPRQRSIRLRLTAWPPGGPGVRHRSPEAGPRESPIRRSSTAPRRPRSRRRLARTGDRIASEGRRRSDRCQARPRELNRFATTSLQLATGRENESNFIKRLGWLMGEAPAACEGCAPETATAQGRDEPARNLPPWPHDGRAARRPVGVAMAAVLVAR